MFKLLTWISNSSTEVEKAGAELTSIDSGVMHFSALTNSIVRREDQLDFSS